MALQIREVTVEEQERLRRLVHSRTDPARTVERARILWLASQGQYVLAIGARLRLTQATVRLWLKRFDATGPDGLCDQRHAGRPPTYTAEAVDEVIAASLTDPQSRGSPFASWTLGRLTAYLKEAKSIAMKPISPKTGGHRPPLHLASVGYCDRVLGSDGP